MVSQAPTAARSRARSAPARNDCRVRRRAAARSIPASQSTEAAIVAGTVGGAVADADGDSDGGVGWRTVERRDVRLVLGGEGAQRGELPGVGLREGGHHSGVGGDQVAHLGGGATPEPEVRVGGRGLRVGAGQAGGQGEHRAGRQHRTAWEAVLHAA